MGIYCRCLVSSWQRGMLSAPAGNNKWESRITSHTWVYNTSVCAYISAFWFFSIFYTTGGFSLLLATDYILIKQKTWKKSTFTNTALIARISFNHWRSTRTETQSKLFILCCFYSYACVLHPFVPHCPAFQKLKNTVQNLLKHSQRSKSCVFCSKYGEVICTLQ